MTHVLPLSPVPPSPIQARLEARVPPARGLEIAEKVGKAQAEAEARARAAIQKRVVRVRGDMIMRAFNAEAVRVFAEETKRAAADASMTNAVVKRAERQEAVQQRASLLAERVELAALRRENADQERVARSFARASKENDAANKRETIVDELRAKAAARSAARSAKATSAAARIAGEAQRKAVTLDAKLAKAEEARAEHLACRVSAAVKSYTPKRETRIAANPLLDFLGQQPMWVRGLAQALLCLPAEAVASLPPP